MNVNARHVAAQIDRIAHGYRYSFTSDPQEELSARIAQNCGHGLNAIVFVSGGSEAVESALKLATERIAVGVQSLMQHGGPSVLRELYARRRASYQAYVDRYFRGSWEEAIAMWWGEKRVKS